MELKTPPKFLKDELNAKYNLLADVEYIVPGIYSGMTSDIPDASIVEGMIERKSNLVERKENKPAAPAKP